MEKMFGRKTPALLLVVPLLLAACSTSATPAAGLPSGLAASPAPSLEPSAEGPTDSLPAPSDAGESPTDVPTNPPPPTPPTGFTATIVDGIVPCPSPNAETGDSCKETDLTWTSTAPGSWFRIYASWTGEGPLTCSDPEMLDQAQPILETDPDATSATLFNALATGGGAECLWITAVGDAGESAPVAAAGQ
jgi:hypothetical protein